MPSSAAYNPEVFVSAGGWSPFWSPIYKGAVLQWENENGTRV